MRTGFDLSVPLAPIAGYDVCAFYLGGDTPHKWSIGEIHAQPSRWRWPIWVCDHKTSGHQQALECLLRLRQLRVPDGTAVMLDLETLTDPAMVNDFGDTLHSAGYMTTPYGSTSSLFNNPPRAGYAVATLDGNARMYDHPHVVGTQYGQATVGTKPHQIVDLWLIDFQLPLWDTKPGPAPFPGWALQAIKNLQDIQSMASSTVPLVRNGAA